MTKREILCRFTFAGKYQCNDKNCPFGLDCNKAEAQLNALMDEGEIEKIILENDDRDYCRACTPCKNPPCESIKKLAKSIKEYWDNQ